MRYDRRCCAWLLILASLVLLASCVPQQPPQQPAMGPVIDGNLIDGVYHNDLYRFTWKGPVGWEPIRSMTLQANIDQPQADQNHMFGWANPGQEMLLGFLAYTSPAGMTGACNPAAMVLQVAKERGWTLQSDHYGTWNGRPIAQAHYSTAAGLDRPSHAVLARLVCIGNDVLVFQLRMPAEDYNTMSDLFQAYLQQVEFAN